MNEDVKSENMRIHSRADELIACLEGEIAKRDEELAACRVAVENCELFRARIVELEANYGTSNKLYRSVAKERDQHAQLIGELEGLLRKYIAPGVALTLIKSTLSAGKDSGR